MKSREASQVLFFFSTTGAMMKNLTAIKTVELAELSEKLGEFNNDEILAFGEVLINEKPDASPSFDAQTLLIYVQKLGTDMMKYLNGWQTSVVACFLIILRLWLEQGRNREVM